MNIQIYFFSSIEESVSIAFRLTSHPKAVAMAIRVVPLPLFLLFLLLGCHLSLPLHSPHHVPMPRNAPPHTSVPARHEEERWTPKHHTLRDPTEVARLAFWGPSRTPSAMRPHFCEALQKWTNCLKPTMPSRRHSGRLPCTYWTHECVTEHDSNLGDETQTVHDIRITSLEVWPHPYGNTAFNSVVCNDAQHSSHRISSYFQVQCS